MFHINFRTIQQPARFNVLAFLTIFTYVLLCQSCSANETLEQFAFQPQSITKISKEFSFGGVEINFFAEETIDDNLSHSFAEKPSLFRPEISLFVSSKSNQGTEMSTNQYSNNLSSRKHNRYKNTIPAAYRLTLKGYSIVEYSNYKTDTWSLNKVKNDMISKPEIMFSVIKRF